MTKESTDIVQLSIRLPKDIRRAIKQEAKRQRRSFNAQLLMYLEEVIPESSREESDQLEEAEA
jgi:hypothetical protein